MPIPVSLATGRARKRGFIATYSAPPPAYWLDPVLFDRRIVVSATNGQAVALYDRVMSITVPAATVDAGSLRAVEVTSLGSVDRAYDWRYALGNSSPNKLTYLPVSISGTTVTLKTLGKWNAGETRYFALYWATSGNGLSALDYKHLTANGANSPYYDVLRSGPDTDIIDATHFIMGFPLATGAGQITAVGWGRSGNTNQIARAMRYTKNVGGQKVFDSATVDTDVANGPMRTLTGTLIASDGAWGATYTATYTNKIVSGRKSDDTGTDTLNKVVDCAHVTLTYTCLVAYAPAASTDVIVTPTAFNLISHVNNDRSFAANVTELVGNQIPLYTAPASTGTITPYAASDDLSALALSGLIVGAHGNQNSTALVLTVDPSASLSGWGSQVPHIKWCADSSGFAQLQIRNMSSGSNVPQGATVTVDFWYVSNKTINALSTGDVLLPDEMVTICRGLVGASPTQVVGSVEKYKSALQQTIKRASANVALGAGWFQDNALAITGTAGNYAYGYNVQTGAVVIMDDDDGNYGSGYMLSGLCLLYKLTHDPALIPRIEAQVQFPLGLEVDAIAQFGSFFSGASPYWKWALSTASSGYTTEGGFATASTSGDVDPAFGSALGPITYNRGDVRRLTSYDQMVMVSMGLYHYLYLLADEPAITANTALRALALAYQGRMVTFEAARAAVASSARVQGNLNKLLNGLTPTLANGITNTELNHATGQTISAWYTSVSAPNKFYTWQDTDTDNIVVNPSSNTAMVNFLRALYATGSTVAGTADVMQRETKEMITADLGSHDVEFTTASWNTAYTASAPSGLKYPRGWDVVASTSVFMRYNAARAATEKHYLSITTGFRDGMQGRSAQRLAVIILTAMLDPHYVIPLEQTGGSSVVRGIPILEYIDQAMNTCALYLPEPTTKANRHYVAGPLGQSGSIGMEPQAVDSTMTAYWMYASALWRMLKAGYTIQDIYPIGAW